MPSTLPTWSATLSQWWGLVLGRPEKFIKSAGEKPPSADQFSFDRICYTTPVLMCWLIFDFNADFGFTAVFGFTAFSYSFKVVHGFEVIYCKHWLYSGKRTGTN